MIDDKMQKFIDFFSENPCGYLATVEGNRPKVRPWSFLFEEDGKIWFLTTNSKRVFKQLQENPYIEFCSYASSNVHGRLSGKVELCNDIRIKERVLDERPMLKNIYSTADNPLLESFYIEHGSISLYSSKLEVHDYIEF